MAWTTPATWVVGAILTAAQLNTHLRDNTRYLKGLDGVPTVESGLTIDNTDGDERLLLPLLSTAECSTVLNAAGEVAYDEATNDIKYYDGSAVISVKNLATKSIASQAQGDILYASSSSVWSRLGYGTSGQFLKTQGAGANPVWASASLMSKGQYTGDGTDDKTVAHSLGIVPKLVFIAAANSGGNVGKNGVIIGGSADPQYQVIFDSGTCTVVTTADATNFYVDTTLNTNLQAYAWVAIG